MADYSRQDQFYVEMENSELLSSGKPHEFGFTDFVTKGVPLTLASVVNSFVNTPAAIGRMFGANTQDWLEMKDYGFGADTLSYYDENKAAVDTAALVIGSFAPGLASLKVLKAAQAGAFGEGMAAVSGVFNARKLAAVNKAREAIETGGLTLTSALNAAKYKAVAYGFGEQALQAATWELATVATMQGNSAIESQDWKQTFTNVAWGAVTGGIIGGSIDSISTLTGIKKTALTKELGEKVTEISKRAGIGDYAEGDMVQQMLDSVFSQPAPTSSSGLNKLKTTTQSAITAAKQMLGMATKGDDTVLSSAFVDSLTSIRQQAIDQGIDPLIVRDQVNKQLRGLVGISRINADEAFKMPTIGLSAVDRRAPLVQFKTADEAWDQVRKSTDSEFTWFRSQRNPDMPVKIAYAEDGVKFKEAKRDAVDIFVKKNGEVRVLAGDIEIVPHPGQNRALTYEEQMVRNANRPAGTVNVLPAYDKSQGTKGQLTSSLYIDLRTGEVFDDKFKVWGIGDEAKSLALTADKTGLIVDGNTIIKQPGYKVLDHAVETVKDVTARWAWVAANMGKEGGETFTRIVNRAEQVSATDLPRLEGIKQYLITNKVYSLDEAADKIPLIELPSSLPGQQATFHTIADLGMPGQEAAVDVIQRIIDDSRKMQIVDLLKEGKSIDEIALRTGADKQWVTKFAQHDPEAVNGSSVAMEIKSYLAPTRARLDYDVTAFTSDVQGNRIFGELDQQYRMAVAKDRLNTVTAAFFGNNADRMKISNSSALDATTEGARPGALTATNADSDTLAGRTQFVGQQTIEQVKQVQAKVQDEFSSSMTAVMDNPAAGAEYAALRAVMSRTGEKFRILTKDSELLKSILGNPDTWMPPEILRSLKTVDNFGNDVIISEGIMFWEGAIKQNRLGYYVDLRELPKGETGYVIPGGANYKAAMDANQKTKLTAYLVENKATAEHLANAGRITNRRLVIDNSLRAAQGRSEVSTTVDGVYFPPVNTKRYPHFAFIRKETQTVLDEKEEISFIVAQSADELKSKIATIPESYRAITKDQAADYHKLMKDFDYDLVVNSTVVDSELRKRGLLSEFYPRANYQELLQDELDHHLRMEAKLVRDHVEAANAELFATLRGMSDNYKTVAKSHMGIADENIRDPYQSYINTAMAIPERAGPFVSMWFDAQRRISDKVSTVFNSIQELMGRPGAKPTDADFLRMSDALEKVGYGNPYRLALNGNVIQAFEGASRLPPQQYLERWSSKVQNAVATMGIRLDLMQSFINAVSTPVMLTMQAESARLEALKKGLQLQVPGSNATLPGTMRLMFQAVRDVTGADGRKLTQYYTEFGAVRNKAADFAVHDLYDALRIVPGDSVAATIQSMENSAGRFVEAAQKVALSDKSEVFVRAWAARTAHIIYEAAGYTGKELEASILTFVNRVHGNHLTSQRPLLFQGWLGQAVGLYQTYQLNLIQQMVREIALGNKRSVAMAMGAQGSLFGMQGLPGFHLINDQLIGNAEGNTAHHDMYSMVPSYLGETVGKFAMYGGVSNLLGAGIYTRGDISPRQITVIPVMPTDWPAVAVSARAISNVFNAVGQMANGGNLWDVFTRGLEHNAMNRPVSGFAQVVQGYSTTSQGSLISSNRPIDGNLLDLFTWGNVSRMLGARPLDEAIALDDKFRMNLYKAADKERLQSLGAAVKSKLVGKGELTQEELEDFAVSYAARGGRADGFGRTMMAWTRDANQSVVNQVYGKMRTPVVQRAISVMGGEKLPDYLNQPGEVDPAATGGL